MRYPEKPEALALLKKWQAMHAKADALCDGVHAVFGNTPDSQLFETVWFLFDAYTTALSAQLGDVGDWLPWFANENDMGAKKRDVMIDKKMRRIKNLRDLLAVIEESRAGERNA